MKTFALRKLSNLASIYRGHSFRARIEPNETGDVSVIQMGDIQADSVLDSSELASIQFEGARPECWLKTGDVLLGSRGGALPAALVPEGLGRAIAASSVLIIRPDLDVLDPGYLVWFLNSPALGQRQLLANQQGSNIQAVNPKGLADIKINVPSLKVQHKIGALSTLQRQENELVQQLKEKRTRYTNAVLMKCMKGELT